MSNTETISREQIEAVFDLKAGYALGVTDVAILQTMARMILAGMDSEPYWWAIENRHGDARFIEVEHAKNDIWDEVHELNEKDDAGEYFDSDAPYTVVPVFRHAAPPANVPEMTDAMAIDFIKDRYLFDDVLRATKLAWNSCRASMNK